MNEKQRDSLIEVKAGIEAMVDMLQYIVSFRAVELPDDVIDKVEDENPTTPTLLEAKYSVLPELEASFEKFYMVGNEIVFL